MNIVVLMGRLTSDPDIRYSQDGMAIARFSLAVDRRGTDKTDFISCNAFGKSAEFAEKYLTKGMKITLSGRIQTGSYTNKDNQKVYTTDVVVNQMEFCEKKADVVTTITSPKSDEFMSIPEGIDEELPFN